MSSRWLAGLLSVSLCLARAAHAEPAPRTPLPVVARMSTLPPLTIRLHFISDVGDDVTVEFDPSDASSLVRRATLIKEKQWSLVVDSQPGDDGHGGIIQLRSIVDLTIADGKIGSATTADLHVHACPAGGCTATSPEVYTIKIDTAPRLPTLADRKVALGSGATAVGTRALLDSNVPQAVQELFQILAEIAFDTAKKKAFSILSARVTRLVCDDLRIDVDALVAAVKACASSDCDLKDWATVVNPKADRLLPATCDAIQNLRVQELGASSKLTYQALIKDLSAFAAKLLSVALKSVMPDKAGEAATVVSEAVRALADHQGALDAREAQTLLVSLGRIDWKNLSKIGCGLDVAFAVLAECEKRNCTPRDVADMLRQPSTFSSEPTCPGLDSGDYAFFEQLVARASHVLRPAKSASPRGLVRDVTLLAFDVFERAYCGVATDACPKEKAAGLATIKKARVIASSVIDQEAAAALVAVSGLIEDWLARVEVKLDAKTPASDHSRLRVALHKTSALLGAVMAYAATYDKDNSKDAKAAHEARKKAIESLIASTTDRSNRDGEWVVSLGASVGFNAVGLQSLARDGGSASLSYGQLELPLGVAAQFLPDGRNKKLAWGRTHLGFHLQISAIDLAQFVSIDGAAKMTNVSWANFVTVALQLGVLVGTPSSTFLIGTEVRWSPTLFSGQPDQTGAASAGALRFGLVFCYYVPFFDFN